MKNSSVRGRHLLLIAVLFLTVSGPANEAFSGNALSGETNTAGEFAQSAISGVSNKANRSESEFDLADNGDELSLREMAARLWDRITGRAQTPTQPVLRNEELAVVVSNRMLGTQTPPGPLKAVLSEGINEYMQLAPVQVLIGLEFAADILTCCGIIQEEPGIETVFLAAAANALGQGEWRPDWKDRVLRTLALVEAARGNIKVARDYMNNIEDITVRGDAAFHVAIACHRFGLSNDFEQMVSEWLMAAEALPAAQRDWIMLWVAEVLLDVGYLERGRAIADLVLTDTGVGSSVDTSSYHRALSYALAREGAAKPAIVAAREAARLDRGKFVRLIIENADPAAATLAMTGELSRLANQVRPDVALIFDHASGLARLGEANTALEIPVRRQQARDAISLGLLSGMIEGGLTDAALEFQASADAPHFERLMQSSNIWLQVATTRVWARSSLVEIPQDAHRAIISRALIKVDDAAVSDRTKLALLEIYAEYGLQLRVIELGRSLPENTTRRVQVETGGLDAAAEAVLSKPSGLRRGVMLLQLAQTEVHRREEIRNRNAAPPSR